jgi:hypothetical protein
MVFLYNAHNYPYKRGIELTQCEKINIRNIYSTTKSITRTAIISRRSYKVVKKYVHAHTIEKKKKGRPVHNTPCRNIYVYGILEKVYELNNALPLRIVASKLSHALNISLKASNLCKILKLDHLLLNYKRKRLCVIAKQRETPRIQFLRQKIKTIMCRVPKEKVIFVDETHVTSRNFHALYGQIKNGWKNVVFLPFRANISCSFCVAMGYGRIISIYYKDTRQHACTSLDYVEFMSMIPFEPDKFIFQDNAALHKDSMATNYQKNVGWTVINNSPFSADLNPIELLLNYVKGEMRKSYMFATGENVKEIFIDICEKIPSAVLKSFVDHAYRIYFNRNYR